MNPEAIISYKDIMKYPLHEIGEIGTYDIPSFALYQYGPTLVMTKHEDVSRYANDLGIKNSLFLLMYDVATIILAINSNKTYKEAKEIIVNLIRKYREKSYKYSDKVISIASEYLDKIKKHQYDENSLESAMLNYCPIVPYAGMLVKPEMTGLYKYGAQFRKDPSPFHQSMLNEKIKTLLIDNIVAILVSHKAFLNTENYHNGTLPSNILDLQEIPDSGVRDYFTNVYLRYLVPEDKLEEIYNKIVTIEKSKFNPNFSEILESFSDIDFKEEDFI